VKCMYCKAELERTRVRVGPANRIEEEDFQCPKCGSTLKTTYDHIGSTEPQEQKHE